MYHVSYKFLVYFRHSFYRKKLNTFLNYIICIHYPNPKSVETIKSTNKNNGYRSPKDGIKHMFLLDTGIFNNGY